MKKLIALILALCLSFSCAAVAFAQELPPLTALDTSAVDGKLTAYVGEETYFVVYPEPLEAEARFDVRNAVITCSEEGIVKAEPEKVEEYRFGSVNITGLKLGTTDVTVTEPESGVSVTVRVTVMPGFLYRLQNFYLFLDYIPFYLFAWILRLFGRDLSMEPA